MIKKCKFCGKEFEAKTKLKKYCCQSCRERAQVAANSEYRERKKAARGRTKQCVMCGAEFEPVFRNRKYCSDECAKKAVADMKKSLREERKKAEEVAAEKVKKRKGYTVEEWNALTPAERWERMKLIDIDKENLKYHIPSYGKSQTMARRGMLPKDYGRREGKRNK